MSEALRIALVAEGPTDYIVIEAALNAILDHSFILTQLQPEATQPQMGSGWGGVLKWCHETAKRHTGSLDDDPVLENFDLIIFHLDTDVAGFAYPDCGPELVSLAEQSGWAILPCSKPCPPAIHSADALITVLHSWLGQALPGQRSIFCLPAQASGTWLAVAVLPSEHPLLQDAECNIHLEARLGQLPKADRIKKSKREYQAKAEKITEHWHAVKATCSQAQRFENAVQASLTNLQAVDSQ
ncbi:MAG: hypothetical protein R3E95_09350 [Thiolinea sp.]